jgi:hypothetical protein
MHRSPNVLMESSLIVHPMKVGLDPDELNERLTTIALIKHDSSMGRANHH